MSELGVVPSMAYPISVLCDNTGAIAQAKEPSVSMYALKAIYVVGFRVYFVLYFIVNNVLYIIYILYIKERVLYSCIYVASFIFHAIIIKYIYVNCPDNLIKS